MTRNKEKSIIIKDFFWRQIISCFFFPFCPSLLLLLFRNSCFFFRHFLIFFLLCVLHALSASVRKCGCRWVGQAHLKKQENRAVIAWRGAASARLVLSADRAYMKAPVPRPSPDFGTKCPELVDTLTKKQTDFSLKIAMGGKPF